MPSELLSKRRGAVLILMRKCGKPVIAAVEGHDNAGEGLRAFFDKRAPRFS
jgi:hypothetical protein